MNLGADVRTKEKLLGDKKRAEEMLRRLPTAMEINEQYDLAVRSGVLAEVESERERLKEIIQQVENFLAEEGRETDKICEGCGFPIDPGRIAVVPMARYCTPCQRERDPKHLSPGCRRRGHI